MKRKRYSRIFAVLLIVMMLTAAILPASPVSAASMTLTPNAGAVSSSVTAAGTGYLGYIEDELYLYFGSIALTAVTVDPGGAFSGTFTVPAAADAGFHTVSLQTTLVYNGGITVDSATYTVGGSSTTTGSLILSSTSGLAGTSATVSASALTAYASTARYLYFDANLVAVANINSVGAFPVVTFTVPPSSTSGTHTVSLRTTESYSTSSIIADAVYTVTGTTATGVTVSPTSGDPGNTVVATATGLGDYPELTELFIFFGTTYRNFGQVESGGGLSVGFTVPSSATPGTHTISLQTGGSYGSGTIVASTTYTVVAPAQATVTLTPASAKAGATITVTGTTFTASSTLTLRFDTTTLSHTNGSSSSAGTFSTTFVVPTSTGGAHNVVVTDAAAKTATAVFTLTQKTALAPTSGKPDDIVTLTGSGFSANRPLTATFDGIPTTLSSGATDTRGAFVASFTVPESSGRTHDVIVSDGLIQATLQFNTSASVSLSQASGKAGQQITVNGTSFVPNLPVILTLNKIQIATPLADAFGHFSHAITLPALPPGSYTLEVRDSANLVNTSITISADVSISHASGSVGSEITVSGQGFSGNVTIGYDNVEVARTTATASGAFSANITIPVSTAGEHVINATDGITNLSSTFVMEAVPPDAPAAVSPPAGAGAVAETEFHWVEVKDDSGLIYELQIATDNNFANVVLEKLEITESNYTIPAGDKLEARDNDGAYYWRVRAVDTASNTGNWSEAWSFTVKPKSDHVVITGIGAADPDKPDKKIGGVSIWVWVGVGLGMVAMFGTGFIFGRRSAYY